MDRKKKNPSFLDRVKGYLTGRKPMETNRKKAKRGAAGEIRDYKLKGDRGVGALQKRNKSTQDQLDQLD